jgi:hypothetical protein
MIEKLHTKLADKLRHSKGKYTNLHDTLLWVALIFLDRTSFVGSTHLEIGNHGCPTRSCLENGFRLPDGAVRWRMDVSLFR